MGKMFLFLERVDKIPREAKLHRYKSTLIFNAMCNISLRVRNLYGSRFYSIDCIASIFLK